MFSIADGTIYYLYPNSSYFQPLPHTLTLPHTSRVYFVPSDGCCFLMPTASPPDCVVSLTIFPAATNTVSTTIFTHSTLRADKIRGSQHTLGSIPHPPRNTRNGVPNALAQARHCVACRVGHSRDAFAKGVGCGAESVACGLLEFAVSSLEICGERCAESVRGWNVPMPPAAVPKKPVALLVISL
jgi:hypothetical protein